MILLMTWLLFIFSGAILCNGWHEITRKGKVFGFWQKYWEGFTMVHQDSPPEEYPVFRFPSWISDPVSGCVMCYASVYGSIIFWSVFIFQREHFPAEILPLILMWISYCVSLAYCNYIVHRLST